MKSFNCEFDENGILTSLSDPCDTDWKTIYITSLGEINNTGNCEVIREWNETGDGLTLTVTLKNNSAENITLDNITLPVKANTDYVRDKETTYYKRVMQQACVCGNSSFVYWHRPSGDGRFLALIPLNDICITEELNTYPWAMKFAPVTIHAGDAKELKLKLIWMKDHGDIQQALVNNGGVGISVVPGLVIPQGLKLMMRLRSRKKINSVACDGERIDVTETQDGCICTAEFSSFGEKTININYGSGLTATVVCYATKPLEKLIDSIVRHIVEKQRYTGTAWYDGLFSQWNMSTHKMSTPDDTDGLPLYSVSADDPGLCKAPYIAEKNVFRPDEKEIAAVEYYINHFLWGGLQRTGTEKPYPWGIIGSDAWKANRESKLCYGNGGLECERMWRTFDYTHIIQLYYNMYLIAKNYPKFVHEMDADGYLHRALMTAKAYFEVPYQIYMGSNWDFHGYCDWAFKLGNFHEKYILPLLDACREETAVRGKGEAGSFEREIYDTEKLLRGYWETKVKYMIYDNPLPFGSEMWFDSTAYESTQAVGHYAMTHTPEPDEYGWFDRNLNGPGVGGWRSHTNMSREKERDFLDRQMKANIACRGSQLRSYYELGSDYRSGGYKSYLLSYMSQMGGAAVLDYALYFDKNPTENIRLGYASLLSSWSLVNLGENDPFFPSAENKGAAGWGFQPEEPLGETWLGKKIKRGPWMHDGEIDSGFSSALYSACTILCEDHDFGTVYYGGRIEKEDKTKNSLTLIPLDGVRREFHNLRATGPLHLRLNRDAIKKITICDTETYITIENITCDAHTTYITVNGTKHNIEIKGTEAVFKI